MLSNMDPWWSNWGACTLAEHCLLIGVCRVGGWHDASVARLVSTSEPGDAPDADALRL